MQRSFNPPLLRCTKFRPSKHGTGLIHKHLQQTPTPAPTPSTRSLSASSRHLARKRKPNPHYHPSASRTTNPFRETPKQPKPPSSRSPFPIPFWLSVTAAGFAASIAYVAVLFLREPPIDPTQASPSGTASAAAAAIIPEDVSDRYHQTAATFDADVSFFESASGLNRLRKRLVKGARGRVLEVSAGTGRNLAFYDFGPGGVRELVLLDQAGEMLEVAERKARGELSARNFGAVRFLTQSALDAVPGTPSAGFDFVVQTMGLCSTGDPVGLLRTMAGLVKVGEGRILLLEHGRGWFGWLNRALDRWAPAHADRHGCWWNRDIGAIVREVTEGKAAVLEGGRRMEVVRMDRRHLGTTWWVELKVTEGDGRGGKA